MNIFTIGFTQKPARQFFETLRKAGVRRILDVRLNNVSQLAGFSKRDDLAYFLEQIGGIQYQHLPILAPTQEMLDQYKQERGSWEAYAERFLALMEERKIEAEIDPSILQDGCLLCSEHEPHQCHRRLVAEYLRGKWPIVEIAHLP